MARKKTHVRASRRKKAPPVKKPKPVADPLTTLARELVHEFEKIELRRWDGWMDQMIQ